MKKVLIISLIILVPLLIGCIVLLVINKEDVPDYKEYRPEIIEKYEEMGSSVPGILQNNSSSDNEYSSQREIDYLEEVKAINPDTVAWITINDTNIDYPVVQANDNDYYLHRGFNKKKLTAGTPFLDYRCEKDFSCFNSIIYGHNMKSMQMFAHVNLFKEKEFFDTHLEGKIVLTDGIYKLNIIAVLVLPNDGFIYDTVFLSSSDKENFGNKLKESAKYYREPKEDITKTGVITLSTCSYEFKDARTVIVGYIENRNKK